MSLNIGYFADGKWGHMAFKKLIKDKSIKISFICARFDSTDQTLKKYSRKYRIDFLKHENVNSTEFISRIANYKCDLLVSMSFNQIFKKKIINLTKYKIINCHAGKLPFYRGRNVLNWALINDEKEFGITVHFVDEKIDTGNIILQRTFSISDRDNYNTLLKKAHTGCANILFDSVMLFKKGNPKSFSQKKIHPVGSYCPIRKVGDEIINWNQTSREIFNFVRAICIPGPIARSFINKIEMKINKVEYVRETKKHKLAVGTIMSKTLDGFLVKTKDGHVKVTEYEFQEKVKVGDKFET